MNLDITPRTHHDDDVSLALMIASFIVLAQFSGAPPGSTYVPAHVEGGKLVPGVTR